MKCPACNKELKEIGVSGVKVDVCDGGCGGIWFDSHELKAFDEPHETTGETLLNTARDTSLIIDRSGKIGCPRCQDVTMMKHFFSVKHSVEIDECAACGGIWLDPGELGQIRKQFDNEEDRKQAAKIYFAEVLGDDFAAMKATEEEKLHKTRRIVNIFKFICPSFYVPGKQDWGAF